MTPTGSHPLPRTAVVSLATAAVHRAKVIAGASAAAAAACLLAGAADVVTSASPPGRDDAAAVFWVVVLGAVAALAWRRARRVAGTARRAAGDPGTTWALVGKLVVAADDRGQPAFDASFKVTAAERAMMIAAAPRPDGGDVAAGADARAQA